MLWAIARSSTIEMYKKAVEDLKEYDNEAYKWVEKAPHPMHWCKAYFSPHTKCDMIVNNLCESFNSHILEARDKPIISCLENIRELMMERIQKRKAAMTRYPHSTGPLIRKIVEDRIEESFQWFPQFNGIDGYQVKGPRNSQFAVNLRMKSCTCRIWELSGLPCTHAIAAIKQTEDDPHEMIVEYYYKSLFLQIYNNVLQPISSQVLWPESSMLQLDPPIPTVQPGRPKKARRRDETEGKNHGRKLRKNVTMHCRKCGKTGHNAATCKEVTEHQQSGQPKKKKHVSRRKQQAKVVQSQGIETQGLQQQETPLASQPSQPIASATQQSDLMSQHPTPPLQQPIPVVQQPDPAATSSRSGMKFNRNGKRPLTDADKGMINANYAYLGKEPPFKVGRWRGRRGANAGRSRSRSTRGRSAGAS
ncbi:uncharacterized protein LOC113762002 [Coffea eugenioides]|uniref:uncharacterized protein LOC113762002 n=1 Tax=Coffea eugenioides TaxID=49369 RepID=UPI000F607191|nr:uncharacterized protein LOC113762002 [Coffea eugenioides]